MARDDRSYDAQSFRQLAWRLSANSSIYTAALIVLRFGGLLLIPLYWRYLDPADYGVIAAAGVVTNFLAVFLGLAVSESITRFYHAWPAAERRDRVGTLWMVDWASSVAIGLPLAIWGADLVQLAARQVPFSPYLRLAVLAAVLHSLSTAPTTLLRIQERPRTYVICSAVSFLMRTAVTIYLVVGERAGPLGVLQAEVISAAAMLPVWTVIMLQTARPAWRADTVRSGLQYSLPLVPGVLSESLAWTMDRFVLEKFVPLAALGVYTVADSLGGVVRIVSGGLKTAWVPFAARAAIERSDAPKVIARAATLYVMGTTLLALGVAMLAGDVIAVIGVAEYFPAAPLVPFFAVSNMLLALLPPALSGLGIARRTGYASATALLQGAVAMIGLLVLVPRAGIAGAIAAVMLATATRLVGGLAASQKFYPVPFEWRKIGLLAATAAGTFILGRALPAAPSIAGFVLRGAVFVAYAGAALWMLGGRRWWGGYTAGATTS